MSRLRQFNYRRWLPLGLIVLIPLLLLFTALRFVQYEQQESIHHVNVAVVNQDQPASFQGKTVDLGSGVLNQLKHNDQINWHFVSESVADQKLANGQYLMKITLPKDFSQNATTALSTTPQQSTIDLSMSDHNNFASHMITTTVAQQLQSEVTSNVQKAYDKTLLQAVNKLGDGLKSASAGTTKLAAGTKQLNAGLATLQSKTKPLGDGVFQLLNGSQQLEAGATKLVNNNAKLNNGAQTLNGGVNQLAAGSQTLQTKLTEAASEINGQLAAAKPDLAKLDHGFTVLNAGIKQLANGVNGAKVNVDSKKLKTDLVSVANAGTGAGKSATAAGTNLQDMSTKLFSSDNDKSVATQMTAAGTHFTKAGDAMTKLSQMGLMKLALQMMPGLKSNLETIQKKMLAGKDALTGAGDSLKSAGGDAQSLATNLKGIGTALTPMKGALTDVQTQLTPLNKMLPKLTELRVGVNQLADQKTS